MKRYRKAVSAVVLRPVREGYKILLVHKPRKRDDWQLPQGGIEDGETQEMAARRELMEEVSLPVGALIHHSAIVYTYDFPPEFISRHKPYHSGQTLFFTSFLADNTSEIAVDNDEVDDHAWVLPQELSQYMKRMNYLKVVKQVLDESLEKLRAKVR